MEHQWKKTISSPFAFIPFLLKHSKRSLVSSKSRLNINNTSITHLINILIYPIINKYYYQEEEKSS
ncbi:MAG: hypothetical protein MJ252_23410 [archaeon]|nr:hypothetical protein [archaeon]